MMDPLAILANIRAKVRSMMADWPENTSLMGVERVHPLLDDIERKIHAGDMTYVGAMLDRAQQIVSGGAGGDA